eukprot:795297_1
MNDSHDVMNDRLLPAELVFSGPPSRNSSVAQPDQNDEEHITITVNHAILGDDEHLSSENANKILIELLERTLGQFCAENPFSIPTEFLRVFLSPARLFGLASVVMFFVAYGINQRPRNMVEAVLLMTALLGDSCFCVYRKYCKHFELYRLMRTRIDLVDLEMFESGLVMDSFSVPSSNFVWTIRDARLIKLPPNVLVPGDLIELQVGDTVPCACDLVDIQPPSQADSPQMGGPASEPRRPVSSGKPLSSGMLAARAITSHKMNDRQTAMGSIYSLEKNQFVTRQLVEKAFRQQVAAPRASELGRRTKPKSVGAQVSPANDAKGRAGARASKFRAPIRKQRLRVRVAESPGAEQ